MILWSRPDSPAATAQERKCAFLLPARDADPWRTERREQPHIDLCYVGCGRIDAFWEFGLNPWDMAAGFVILEEAGGRTSEMTGKPANVRSPHILASNGILHAEIEELFAEIFRGEYRYSMVEMPALST